jgi:ubiquinone/menaquinone biosynthesis C-methylase UbiE
VTEPFQHPHFAAAFARAVPVMDARGAAAHRARLVLGLTGRVLELGAGTGAMFAHYPPTVTAVLAVEPEDALRDRAERAAETAPVPVTVVAGHADDLPAGAGSIDAVVAALVLCSVPRLDTALAELRRVLRPGGELRFYEHVRSDHRLAAALERLITPAWAAVAGGCHPARDTVGAIRQAGFTVDRVERFGFSAAPLLPRTAHVLGTAHR